MPGDSDSPTRPPSWPPPMPEVAEAIQAALVTGAWGLYRGEHVPQFEAELAAFHSVPHALTCASGTLAVEIALRAIGVRPGDEVLMAAYDYESNFLSVHALGAKPVLVDVHPRSGNLDPEQLEVAVSASTRAVIASHLHGGLVPMREVMEFARSRNIGVVEDAAQAAGATVQRKSAGSWGDVGTLSFGGSKLLTAGRGGALLIRDAQVHQRARVALHRGVQPWAPLSELQAIVLRPQLKRLPEMTRLRSERVAWLKERIAGLRPFENAADLGEPAYYKLGFHYDATVFGRPRDAFTAAMRRAGVAFDAGFHALHIGRSPSRFRAVGSLPNATALHEQCVVLHHPVLSGSEADMQHVVDAFQAFAAS